VGSETVRTTGRLRELLLYLYRRMERPGPAGYLDRAAVYQPLRERIHAEMNRRWDAALR
jgi:hypothetical protein